MSIWAIETCSSCPGLTGNEGTTATAQAVTEPGTVGLKAIRKIVSPLGSSTVVAGLMARTLESSCHCSGVCTAQRLESTKTAVPVLPGCVAGTRTRAVSTDGRFALPAVEGREAVGVAGLGA
jgi:hypothetical protein